MYLSNDIKLYCKSMNKVFKVRHIAKSADEANKFTETHKDTGVIAIDNKTQLVFIADIYSLTVKSNLLPE